MLLALTLPRINVYMASARIDIVHDVTEGAPPSQGGKLFDITVDLSAAAPHDCPPVSHYRLAVRDFGQFWLRRLEGAAVGDEPAVGREPRPVHHRAGTSRWMALARPRRVRVTIAGIIPQASWGEV